MPTLSPYRLFLALLAPTVLAVALPHGVRAQAPTLWHGLSPGRWEVGFERVWDLDQTRVWPRSPALDSLEGSVAWPVRVDVWYPTDGCAPQRRVPFRVYLERNSPSPDFDDLVFLTHRWDEYSFRGLAGDSASFERLMEAGTAACLEASPATGPFPLVVYSGGWFNRSPDNTVLAEYLASHGFVVAAVPQSGSGLWTFEFASTPTAVEHQIRDLELALAVVADRPEVDRRSIAAMGYSTGGDVALLLQGRNRLVDAVVGLDASWSLGAGNDVAGSLFFALERHDVPVLAARRPVDDPEASAILDSLTFAPRVLVEIPNGDHGTFSDDPAQRGLLGTDTQAHVATHAAMAQTVLTFLQEALDRRSVTFDGAELAERYRDRNLRARFVPASSEQGKSGGPN